MLTDPDVAYLRRIADGLLPGMHRDRVLGIARDIELFLTRVEDSVYEIDHATTTPPQRLADIRDLLTECLVAEDTRVDSEETTPVAGAVGRYVKRPVEVEAIQYDGSLTNALDILDWIGDATSAERTDDGNLVIHTLEGNMTADGGDYVIRGVQGEFYPCKPAIFLQSYQPAPDPAQEA